MINAKILTDSLHPNGSRLTTFELTYPRCIHSEMLTHRTFSRNSASSRAIPISKTIKEVEENPFIPMVWGKNQSGMQARQVETDPVKIALYEEEWRKSLSNAVESAKRLEQMGLHKQIVNRVLEPYTFITVIATTCEKGLRNFFNLRSHEDAEPHIHALSDKMKEVYETSEPSQLNYGDYHLPLIGFEGDEEIQKEDLKKVSTGRCARVSYKTHDGKRDISKDIGLHDRLANSKHWSPFEHVAQCVNPEESEWYSLLKGNFDLGWVQYRKTFQNEFV